MHGCIRLKNGDVLWFNDNNLHEVVERLTDKQRKQVADLLQERLGPKPDSEFGVDHEVERAWHESVHRKDVKLGGSSSNGESNINKKGTKKMVRNWDKKSEADKNITWLLSIGFRRKWSRDAGYRYQYRHQTIDLNWIQEYDHELFKSKVVTLLDSLL